MQVLEEAISALRRHRSVLGETVVETAVSALQDQILAAGTAPLIQQFETVAILQADISGFTAMSARMDAEQVSDAINALWQRLDNVVLSWGGQIEQHTGDGLIALFGVPVAQEDDAQRAILAALDMQMELSLFNEAASEPTDTSPLGRLMLRTDFRMRIGVHSGPLLWGRVGQSLGETAVGDTVEIVGLLEKMCPVDGVLISIDVYRQVFGLFDVEPGTSLSLPENGNELPLYVVKGEKSRAMQTMTLAEHGIKSAFVGRTPELERLEFALQETLDNGVMQVVTVTGEAGIGKSRLFDAFERWLTMLPVQGCLMRAQSERSETVLPFTALRNLFMDYFEIHQRSTLPVMLEKFSRGVERVAGAHKISAQEQAHVLGHLLGFDFSHSPYVRNLQDQPEKLEKYGLQDLVRFFTDLSAQMM
ncbi:MAG: AAA family ATPase, partial [Anaerolineae bacterium]|nr:AAA family ATPase [Anaerolineae bacterium]